MTLTFPKINLPSRITIKKPEINLGILQKTVGYIVASVSLIPPLRPIVLGITTIADIGSNGKSSNYLNNGQKSNSTLNFVPGGDLFQKILNDGTKGKSGEIITNYTPDVKKMAIQELNHKKNTFIDNKTINGTKESNKSSLHNNNYVINERNTVFPMIDLSRNYINKNENTNVIIGKKQIIYKKEILNNIEDNVIIKENDSTFSNTQDTTKMNY